jgi:hypothetical protein
MANEKEVLSSTNRQLDERAQIVFFQKDEIIREFENKIEKEFNIMRRLAQRIRK